MYPVKLLSGYNNGIVLSYNIHV